MWLRPYTPAANAHPPYCGLYLHPELKAPPNIVFKQTCFVLRVGLQQQKRGVGLLFARGAQHSKQFTGCTCLTTVHSKTRALSARRRESLAVAHLDGTQLQQVSAYFVAALGYGPNAVALQTVLNYGFGAFAVRFVFSLIQGPPPFILVLYIV